MERIEEHELDAILTQIEPGAGGLNGPAQTTRKSRRAVGSPAEEILQEKREVPQAVARVFVEQFDNRDNDYDKGLEKLNRWLDGGQGTPFQWRGDRAYLNLLGAGPTGVKNYEEQITRRLGFSRRLGRLVVPGLKGEVVVYERP